MDNQRMAKRYCKRCNVPLVRDPRTGRLGCPMRAAMLLSKKAARSATW
jgi:uncharacterized Zn finger protein (UPF0148 family)